MDPLGPDPSETDGRLSPDPKAEEDKISKDEVAYGHPPNGRPNQVCARCAYYDGAFRCDIVRGDITPDMWCTEWLDGHRDVSTRGRTSTDPQGRSESTLSGNVGVGLVKPILRKRKEKPKTV
ncbi:MAG: hypothetical protein E6R03_04225 [Hyphomicrobiaceae bacterium]|nr:MAG: hypothetical protein E6R03_04225 [Hyphomicrobiaceae bacterium]